MHGVVVHWTRSLPIADRAEVDGIPVTRPARTLIDLAAVVGGDDLESALDSALRDRLVTVPYLDRRLAELGSRGRDGLVVLRQLVDDRRDSKPADSQAENRLRRALIAAGLPKPVRQFELYDDRGLAATFDLAYPEARIGIEFDSYRHHSGRKAWRHDQARHNRATAVRVARVFHLTADADVAPIVPLRAVAPPRLKPWQKCNWPPSRGVNGKSRVAAAAAPPAKCRPCCTATASSRSPSWSTNGSCAGL